jgi:hypothetical protein
MSNYKFYKDKWESIKPIRGRSIDVRPAGKRSRDWETITRAVTKDEAGNTVVTFGAKLHGTECVQYFPNGDIVLRTNGWNTPSTAEFIHEHSPFTCFKAHKKLWVRLRRQPDLLTMVNNVVMYPLPTELRLRCILENNTYEPDNPKPIMQRVVDRAKAKAARAPMQPFLQFVKTFLAMSDGWVMHDTMMEFFDMSDFGYRLKPAYASQAKSGLYEALLNAKSDDYLFWLCLLSREVNYLDQRKVQTQGVRDYMMERQLKVDAFKALVEKFVRECADIYKEIEVEPSAKARTNLV